MRGYDTSDRQAKHMAALTHFDREMDALMHPVTKEPLLRATENLLTTMFEYSPQEAATRTRILDEQRDIPTDYELDNEAESIPEILRIGLFDKLPEEYIIRFGMEEFDKWIGPYIRSVLVGHLPESSSYEHEVECPDDRFCPADIITCFINDRLCDQTSKIMDNIEYAAMPNEMVYMNTRIVQELEQLGVYTEEEVDSLLEGYRWWLSEFDEDWVDYDDDYFVW